MEEIAKRARAAAGVIATLAAEVKNACLRDLADRIESETARIRAANDADLAAAGNAGLTDAKIQRLALSDAGIRNMADGLRQIAELKDPVGETTREYTVASGLTVRKVRCPLGVILMIYEARPNVTIDAFALCFKAGNACILKGGREAAHSNVVLFDLAAASLHTQGVPSDVVILLAGSDREEMKALLRLEQYIDLVIPRGGVELIHFVHEHSRIPTVQHFQGVCHIFVDESADLDRAVDLCVTAKTSAPATCNAVEAVLVHRAIAEDFIPRFAARLKAAGVELRGDPTVCALTAHAVPARQDDWGREFLDMILAVRVLPDLSAAIEHIRNFSSNHTEAILTRNEAHARQFTSEVQSSCVLVNASTRFNDGYQLGLGAEIGISTSKIHAYGPMGLEELTAQRYVVQGAWQTR